MKIAARDSAAESTRAATIKGLDDQRAVATKAIATQPAQYRTGTFNAIANAYKDAGATGQAEDTRRLAQLESVFKLFAQSSVPAQRRLLDDLSGPERNTAEAMLQHQQEAFAKDPYAAGTALYADVGPALPQEDAEGRRRQTWMIEARRGLQLPPSAQNSSSEEPVQAQYTPANANSDDAQPKLASAAATVDGKSRDSKSLDHLGDFDGQQLAQGLDLSPHALMRMQQRGISAQQMQDAINSPNKVVQPNGNTKCSAGGVTVILSPAGRVITCY